MSRSEAIIAKQNRINSLQRCVVVPNGVLDHCAGRGMRDERPITSQDDVPVLGTVASLRAQKGYPLLLKAIQLVSQQAQVHIVIVGEDRQYSLIRTLIRKYGIGDCVTMAGHANRPEFNIFILNSLWEGMPYALLEAMTAGLPLIATDVPGNRDVVRNGVNGLLVETCAKSIAGVPFCIYWHGLSC